MLSLSRVFWELFLFFFFGEREEHPHQGRGEECGQVPTEWVLV